MINVMGFRFAQRTARPIFRTAVPNCRRDVILRSLGRGGSGAGLSAVVLRVQLARRQRRPFRRT
jgi:hypothetical protein